jgi:hypothetical protein
VCFFTLVLNGRPFVTHHAKEFQRLSAAYQAQRAATLEECDVRVTACEKDAPVGDGDETDEFDYCEALRTHCDGVRSTAAFPVEWEWHLVEGLARGRAKHWSPYSTQSIPQQFFDACGRSTDGTATYLDDLQQRFPANVRVHRKGGCCHAEGAADEGGADADAAAPHMWRDKVEMCNTVIQALDAPCLLVQVDVDELWTAEMLASSLALFNGMPLPPPPLPTETTSCRPSPPTKKRPQCAYFHCHFFITKDLVTVTPGQYSHSSYEWLRMWVFEPGMMWLDHAPPTLAKWDLDTKEWFALANYPGNEGHGHGTSEHPGPCITHAVTESQGLVFTHYAYVFPAQVQFKEHFYGYEDAHQQWAALVTTGEQMQQRALAGGGGGGGGGALAGDDDGDDGGGDDISPTTAAAAPVHVADYLKWVPPGVFADLVVNRVLGKGVPVVALPQQPRQQQHSTSAGGGVGPQDFHDVADAMR